MQLTRTNSRAKLWSKHNVLCRDAARDAGTKIFAIILGIMFLLMAVTRATVNNRFDPGKYIGASPTAVKTQRLEKDGSKTTIIDDRAQRTHVEVHEGAGVYRITVIDKSTPASSRRLGTHKHGEQVGSMGATISDENVPGVGHVTTIERNSNLPVDYLLIAAGFLAAIMATVFGNALSKENEHLELAWTKPTFRERYALTAIGVDVAAIVASFALAICVMIAMGSLFGIPHLVTSAQTLLVAAVALLFPLSWYALMQGMTASLRRASGLILGLSWPVAFALPALAPLKWSLQPVLQFLDTFNPVAYFTRDASDGAISNTALTFIHSSSISTDAVMLSTLTLLGLTVAIVQWRRLEA